MFLRVLGAAILIAALAVGWRMFDLNYTFAVAEKPSIDTTSGPADAAVTIVEFLDYRCDGCRASWPLVEKMRKDNPDIRYVVRFRPIYGETSVREARLSLAAGLQGRFWEMHEILITRTEPVTPDEVDGLAQQAGVDVAQLREDIDGARVTRALREGIKVANKLGIYVTPSFVADRTLHYAEGRPLEEGDLARIVAAARGPQ